MRTMPYEEKKIAYDIKGKGKPVIFLHGGLTDHTTTGKFTDEIARNGFRVILPDLPAHGKSTYWTPSPKKVVEVIMELMTHLGIKEYDCIGHSMGSSLASELAVRDGRVKKVVLLTPVISGWHSIRFFSGVLLHALLELDLSMVNIAKLAYIRNWLPELPKKRVEERVEEFRRQRREAFWACLRWGGGMSVGKNIRRLGDRCLVIAARFDATAPLKYAEAAAANLEIIDRNHSSVRREDFGKGRNNLFVKFLRG
jgi:pimeloyl-ACP methyl ester carboxylesterase